MKIKLHLISLLLTFTNFFNVNSQNLKWGNQIGNNSYDGIKAVVTDDANNIYVLGYFYNSLDIDPSSNTLNLVSNGDADIYLAKFNSNGQIIWAKSFGGNMEDVGYGLKLKDGHLYLSGTFFGTVDFDPSQTFVNITSNGFTDVFISKFDTSGTFQWVKTFGSVNYDDNRNLSVDINGNIFLPATYNGQVDVDPGNGVYNLTPLKSDVILVKLDVNGDFVWANHLKSKNESYSDCIVNDANGACYIAGYYSDSLIFDYNNQKSNMYAKGQGDCFIYKFNQDGKFVWNHTIGSNSSEQILDIKMDNESNLVFCGTFKEPIDFDPKGGGEILTSNGGVDIFVSKLDSSGTFVWAKSFGSNNFDKCYSLALDNQNNIYMTGVFYNTINIALINGSKDITSKGQTDVFVCKMNSSSEFLGAISFGGTKYDYGTGIYVDNQNNVICAGDFEGTVNLDPSIGSLNLVSKGLSDAFIFKLEDGTLGISDVKIHQNVNLIFPNPSNGNFKVNLKGYFDIDVYSIKGELILSTNSDSIERLNLASGMYYVKISQNKANYSSLLFVE